LRRGARAHGSWHRRGGFRRIQRSRSARGADPRTRGRTAPGGACGAPDLLSPRTRPAPGVAARQAPCAHHSIVPSVPTSATVPPRRQEAIEAYGGGRRVPLDPTSRALVTVRKGVVVAEHDEPSTVPESPEGTQRHLAAKPV